MSSTKTELLLLAAGQSARFAGIKQLAEINGQPMICHCLSKFRQGNEWMVGLANGHVVLGANIEVIIKVLPKTISTFFAQSWQQGIGHSLAESIQVLSAQTTHVLVGLADQINITQSQIEQLLATSKQNPQLIIAAKYNQSLGVPAIFPRTYFSQLASLEGDRGARLLLRKYPQQTISICMPEAAFDIDTRHDLNNI
ncbi:nucleotidyltransferase family protein [uncultured Paraglaciecola sp.]|uniref:nucleotidyltransferase family protein n=1 Tax=uncultured Paraglaciecola sp. TaxID=1765024 RepID=UPI002617D14C|nr:nucleotidyltransferase family protein [uncultured Paraglaciecola sp.]